LNDEDAKQVRQLARQVFWEIWDEELLPLLADFTGARLAVSGSKKEPPATIPESTFSSLRYEDQKGEKLGDFQVAYRAQNSPDAWQHCFNILKANNASIKDSFHLEGYGFRYWIFPDKYVDRIFRKQLEAPK